MNTAQSSLTPTPTQLGWMRAIHRGHGHGWPKGSIWDDRRQCIDAGWVRIIKETGAHYTLGLTDAGLKAIAEPEPPRTNEAYFRRTSLSEGEVRELRQKLAAAEERAAAAEARANGFMAIRNALGGMLDAFGGYQCSEVDAAIGAMQAIGVDQWSMQRSMDEQQLKERPIAEAIYDGQEAVMWLRKDGRTILADIIDVLVTKLDEQSQRAEAAESLLNTPELHDFAKAVVLEAAHQRQRWGSEHDAGKTDADWFWLLGYLGGKALHNPPNDMPPLDAKLHRIIATAAALANWHAAVSGEHTGMRPGIDPAKLEGIA
jgi:hypothetical protein